MNNKTKQILLTNDDSIHSPGLWAAAEALDPLGFVHVVAPLYQQTTSGQSFPASSTGIIETMPLNINGRDWTVYAVDGSPAQAVVHGILDVMQCEPDLLISGINYGENIGASITASGTVGAALEAAAMKIPSIAVSMQTKVENHRSFSMDVDFSTAAYFTNKFARVMLEKALPFDVDILKIDVPMGARPDTPWVITRQSRSKYYYAEKAQRKSFTEPGPLKSHIQYDPEKLEQDGDIYVLAVDKKVSVTPISIDCTSRVDFAMLRALLEEQ